MAFQRNCCSVHAKPSLMRHLHELLCQCWEEGSVPHDMRDINIVALQEQGATKRLQQLTRDFVAEYCEKAFARGALKRLQQLAERIYPESQCGFRTQMSTYDSVHQNMKCFSSRVQVISCSFSPTSEPKPKSVSSCSENAISSFLTTSLCVVFHKKLRRLINNLAHACKEFGFTVSLKRTNIGAYTFPYCSFLF